MRKSSGYEWISWAALAAGCLALLVALAYYARKTASPSAPIPASQPEPGGYVGAGTPSDPSQPTVYSGWRPCDASNPQDAYWLRASQLTESQRLQELGSTLSGLRIVSGNLIFDGDIFRCKIQPSS